MSNLWNDCLSQLQDQVQATEFISFIRPLQTELSGKTMTIYAHNLFIMKWVQDKFLVQIKDILNNLSDGKVTAVTLVQGEKPIAPIKPVEDVIISDAQSPVKNSETKAFQSTNSNVNPKYTFDNYVEGSSNQMARMIGLQIAEQPGASGLNPFFLYGGTGLGKTHLLHAIGNSILEKNPNAKVVYMHSEKFVQKMVKAMQNNNMDKFKHAQNTVDVLLIDDIQFFAKKYKTQEEFFHIFNSLIDRNHQIILTSDCFPKSLENIEDRLKSRFGWGMTATIEPPELETRVAILMKKAEEREIPLPEECAYFLGKKLRTNVRELEGALNRVNAYANFKGASITIDFIREALRDTLSLQEKLVTIENIQKTVAEYYKIKVSDLKSKSRARSIARPRQLAMTLSKELTSHSLPEIGKAFGDRDHTTVLHACRKIAELRVTDSNIEEDYSNLVRSLSA